jgi:preprotein translocase subunit SecE
MNLFSELKKVTWPSREQTMKLTVIVVGISVGMALFIGGLDFVFTNLLTLIVK